MLSLNADPNNRKTLWPTMTKLLGQDASSKDTLLNTATTAIKPRQPETVWLKLTHAAQMTSSVRQYSTFS